MKKIIILFLSICIYGCATIDKPESKNTISSSGDIKIESNDGEMIKINQSSKICVFVPKDGYNPDRYWQPVKGSGLLLANAVTEAFSEYFPQTKEIVDDKDLNKAIQEARAQNYDYIIYPKILVWTDHNTLLSGIPNEAKVNVRVYNIKEKRVENSILINEKGEQFESYGVSSINLMEKPLKEVAEQLVLN